MSYDMLLKTCIINLHCVCKKRTSAVFMKCEENSKGVLTCACGSSYRYEENKEIR